MDNLNRRVYTEHWRYSLVIFCLMSAFLLLAARAFYLQILGKDYLQAQGQARYVREVTVKANRGRILDRNGQTLAVSTPVDSVWANPKVFLAASDRWRELATELDISLKEIKKKADKYQKREFMYLKRHLPPVDAQKIMALNIPGVSLQREYRRFYPAGPVASHVIGFTNIDEFGQEGVELAYNQHLTGKDGRKRVLRDRVGNTVENIESVEQAIDGKDLHLSIDARIQHLAHRYLKAAVIEHQAEAGTAVILDAQTGEILAMVNEPSFNPNNRKDFDSDKFRNRAVTDMLEPGSTTKPFTVAMGLASGRFHPDTLIDTSPGYMSVGRRTIKDTHNYGLLDVSKVIIKSSNVGVTKIALSFPVEKLRGLLADIGYGTSTRLGLPGEINGILPDRKKWRPIEHATLSYGYGFSVTPVQIAQAYTVLASDGKRLPINILKQENAPDGEQVIAPEVISQIKKMMMQVVSTEGTARRAQMEKYTAAGKTGTAHKLINGRYAEKRYTSAFAGFAPAQDPRLIMVVVVDDPRGEHYYGGRVAAPVFAKVMAESLRLMNVPPDKIEMTAQTGVKPGGKLEKKS